MYGCNKTDAALTLSLDIMEGNLPPWDTHLVLDEAITTLPFLVNQGCCHGLIEFLL